MHGVLCIYKYTYSYMQIDIDTHIYVHMHMCVTYVWRLHAHTPAAPWPLHVVGFIPAKSISPVHDDAAAKMGRRGQVVLDALPGDVGMLAAGVAIFVQGAHAAAHDRGSARRSYHPERARDASQLGHMGQLVRPLLKATLVSGVARFVACRIDDEVSAA